MIYPHILHLPLVKVVELTVSLIVPIGPELALKLTSAMAGGIGVGLAYMTARDGAIASSQSRAGATASALLLTGLFGYWIHATASELHIVNAACATLLLWVSFRVLRGERPVSTLDCVLLVIGVVLTPASHISGLCVGLPMLFLWWRAGAARKRVLIAGVVGLGIFAAVYASLMPQFAKYNEEIGSVHSVIWLHPERLPGLLLHAAKEFTVYSLPAAALVPAGILCLRRRSKSAATFCILWFVAWFLMGWPVMDDDATGSYYVPTFPVQAILAIAAWPTLASTPRRTVAALVAAFVPIAVTLGCGELWGLSSTVVSAVVLFAMVSRESRPETSSPVSGLGLFILPSVTLILAAVLVSQRRDEDPFRDEIQAAATAIEAVQRANDGAPPVVMYLRIKTLSHFYWVRFLPGAAEHTDRIFNPLYAGFLSDEQAQPIIGAYRRRILATLAGGGAIWLYGSIDEVRAEGSSARPVLDGFLTFLTETYEFTSPAGGPTDLYRLTPK